MKKMMVVTFDHQLFGLNTVITELKNRGINLKDISLITRVNNIEMTKNGIHESFVRIPQFYQSNSLEQLFPYSKTFPSLDGLFVSGPLAQVLELNTSGNLSDIKKIYLREVISNTLTFLGIPEKFANQYEDVIIGGGGILAISYKDDKGEIGDLLENYGATEIQLYRR